MNSRSDWRVAAPIIAVGALILATALAYVLLRTGPLLSRVLEAGILCVFAAAVLAVGYRVSTESLDWSATKRIVAFTLGTSIVIGGLSGVFVIARMAAGSESPGFQIVLSIGFSLGAGAGALIGYYLNRYETSLEHEAELSRRLTVLQRVLRHNIRNEVTIIEGVSKDLTERVDDPDIASSLEIITEHIGKVYRVAEKSQDLASVWQSDETMELDGAAELHDAVELVQDDYPNATFTIEVPDDLAVQAHPRVGIAFEEILDNAARHNDAVTVAITASSDDDRVTIQFADTGSGIPEAELAPLVRGHERPLAHSTGIGLWFIYWLVDHSNGELSFDQSDAGGTLIEVSLERA